jgi:hypothetical protein
LSFERSRLREPVEGVCDARVERSERRRIELGAARVPGSRDNTHCFVLFIQHGFHRLAKCPDATIVDTWVVGRETKTAARAARATQYARSDRRAVRRDGPAVAVRHAAGGRRRDDRRARRRRRLVGGGGGDATGEEQLGRGRRRRRLGGGSGGAGPRWLRRDDAATAARRRRRQRGIGGVAVGGARRRCGGVRLLLVALDVRDVEQERA